MFLDRLTSEWSEPKPSRDRIDRRTAVVLAAICVAVFAIGVPNLRVFGHDVFLPLDGGWRVLNGQRPAVDFLATIGPAWYLLYAGGLAAAGRSAAGLGWANGFVALTVGVWSFLLLRRRMTPRTFGLACITILLLAVSPYALGYFPWESTFAMTYNRQGYALMGLVFLECFLPSDSDLAAGATFWAGFSTGLACAILLFLKISYGLLSLAVAGLSIAIRYKERRRIAGVFTGGLIFTLPMLAYVRWDVMALARENQLLASVRGRDINPASVIKRLITDRSEILPVLLAGALTMFLPGIPPRRRMLVAMGCAVATGAGAMLILGNAQPSGLPLMALAALLILDELTMAIGAGRVDRAPGAYLLCFVLLAASTMPVMDAAGIAYALVDKAAHGKAGARFDEPHLSALSFFGGDTVSDESNENGRNLVRLTREGIDLARQHASAGESLRGLAAVNPFSYGLLGRPSHGGAVSITERKVSETVVPPLDFLVGDVDLILAPKFHFSEERTIAILLRRYPDLLGVRYVPVAETENWTLYRKRSAR